MARKIPDRSKLMAWTILVTTANSCTQGYDGGMMNGLQILPAYSNYFHTNTSTLALNVSIVFVGAIVVVPWAAVVSDKYGRIWGMAFSQIVAIAGAIIQGSAINEAMFCVGRFLVGASLTLGGVAAPVYVSEVSPPQYRAILTGVFGSCFSLGAIMAALITFGCQYIKSTWCWRIPSLLQMFPSALSILPLFFIPESPRWLAYQDRREEALAMLIKYHGNGDADSPIVALEYQEICQTLDHEKAVQKTSYKAMVNTKPNRWRTGLIIASALGSQLPGNNIISFYLGTILTIAGITTVQTQLAINVGLSAWNLICSIVGSLYIEKMGRRPAFLAATAVMALTLFITAIITKIYFGTTNVGYSGATVFLIFFFNTAYSVVYGPLNQLYPTEILSYSIRSNGLALLCGVAYAAAFFCTFVIPYAMRINWGFYLINSFWDVGEIIFIWYLVPETKQMTLEEIDEVFDGEKHFDTVIDLPEVINMKTELERKEAVHEALQVNQV